MNSIVFFDGVCNLCSGFVQFIIKRDKNAKFKFASLQSEIAKTKLGNRELISIVLLKDSRTFEKSFAALEIARDLDGLWRWTYIFKIIPRFIRDGIYDLVAKYRYQWFGKKEACWIPSPDLMKRYID